MTRIHVKLMHEQRGYTAAKKVLTLRKVRGEFFVLLEMLERERLLAQRRRSSENDAAFSYKKYAYRGRFLVIQEKKTVASF